MWSVLVVWLSAQAGGALISFTGLHPLLGMLLAGVAVANVPVSWLTAPLPASWKSKIRQGALAMIFLRSGLELDWEVFRRAGPAAVRLLLVPGIVEAVVSGSVAHAVFGMPWLLAYALGFILKAVGPAIVIQLMLGEYVRYAYIKPGSPKKKLGKCYKMQGCLQVRGSNPNVQKREHRNFSEKARGTPRAIPGPL